MCPSQSITSASVVITFSSGRFLEPFVRASIEVHHSRAGNAAPSSDAAFRIRRRASWAPLSLEPGAGVEPATY
jgi:hypothetical protein